MANIVRTIADDARIGRLLFSTQLANAVIVRKRAESSALFAMLSGQYAGDALRMPANDRIKAGAHFAVGGVGQTISAWLAGDVRLEPDELVDQLASLLDELDRPAPVRRSGNSGRCQSRIPGSSSHNRIMVSRKMRCAPVIMKIASGTSIPSAVTIDSQTSSGPAVIRSNHASQISSTPEVNAANISTWRRK